MFFVPLLFTAGTWVAAMVGKKAVVGALLVGVTEKAARTKIQRQARLNPNREEEEFCFGGEAELVELRLNQAYLEKYKIKEGGAPMKKYFGGYLLTPLEHERFLTDVRRIASAYDTWDEKRGEAEGKRLIWLKELTRRRRKEAAAA